ncbi:MAG: tryptophan 7-halogenase [Cellvibrio sp.]|nr:tryptophan 7-halogenase [Cellvibrio sp.]
MDKPIKKVAVVGRDADAWLAALILRLSFLKAENPIEIVLIELPSKLHPHEFYSVLPSHQVLHKVMGLRESVVFKTAGQCSLGQRFFNWSGESTSFFHGYDTHGVPVNNIEFLHYWVKARKHMQLELPLEDFSFVVEAAKQGKFPSLSDSAAQVSNATYGYHLNALPYISAIAKEAIGLGVVHKIGELKSLDQIDGNISCLHLSDGSQVQADLYIDASGEDAILISQLEAADNFESWGQWLPCDKKITASLPPLSPMPGFAQIVAFQQGWIGYFPLLNRTALTAIYSSEYATAEQIINKVNKVSKASLKAESVVQSTIKTGARKKSWIGNCVAIGESAASIEPLDATQLHILHLSMLFLRRLFPNSGDLKLEADLYNEKMQSHLTNIRDFLVAHYKLNQRHGEPLWDAQRNMQIPQSLEEKISLFSSRGMVAMCEDETFLEENWASILIGHGIMPETYDPLVEKVSRPDQVKHFQKILQYIAAEVAAMPSMQSHIEINTESSKSSIFS